MWVIIKVTELYRIIDMHTNDIFYHEVKVLYSGINQKVVDIYDHLEDAKRELPTNAALGIRPPCFITKTYFVIEEFGHDDPEDSKSITF